MKFPIPTIQKMENNMKKLLLLLIALTFLAASCGDSKKAENDSDILPDEDATDTDEIDEPDHRK